MAASTFAVSFNDRILAEATIARSGQVAGDVQSRQGVAMRGGAASVNTRVVAPEMTATAQPRPTSGLLHPLWWWQYGNTQ